MEKKILQPGNYLSWPVDRILPATVEGWAAGAPEEAP
jgi:hypothetical protein